MKRMGMSYLVYLRALKKVRMNESKRVISIYTQKIGVRFARLSTNQSFETCAMEKVTVIQGADPQMDV